MARTLTALGIFTVDARCECDGGCGREHERAGDGRCHVTDSPAHPLALVARGRTTTAASSCTRDELVAWCPVCCSHAAKTAHRAADEAAHHDGPDLLDLLAQEVTA